MSNKFVPIQMRETGPIVAQYNIKQTNKRAWGCHQMCSQSRAQMYDQGIRVAWGPIWLGIVTWAIDRPNFSMAQF